MRDMEIEWQTTSRFTVLWLKAQPVVAGYVASVVRDRSAADDIVQNTALTAIEKFNEYDPARSFEAWTIGVARFKILQHLRDTGRDRLVFDDTIIEQLGGEHVRLAESYEDRLQSLRHCMTRLPQQSRQLMTQRYFREMSVKSIAAQLGLTPERISRRLFSIRRALEQCIRQRLEADQSRGGRP